MPCVSDYLEPNARERESVLVNKLLVFILPKVGLCTDKYHKDTANKSYGEPDKLDDDTNKLCAILSKLKKSEQKRFLDWNVKENRPLAQWWEHHQEADAKRKKKEKKRSN